MFKNIFDNLKRTKEIRLKTEIFDILTRRSEFKNVQ